MDGHFWVDTNFKTNPSQHRYVKFLEGFNPGEQRQQTYRLFFGSGMDDYLLDSQLILDSLRVRSALGGTQLQDLLISREKDDDVLPASVMTHLGELVSHVQGCGKW